MTARRGPLRVAFVTALIMGGSERQQMELARRLPRDRFEVTFVIIGERGPHAEIVEANGSRVMALGASRQATTPFPLFALRVSSRVARYAWWCRRQRFDIADAWLYHGYGLAALTKRVGGVPVLVTGRRSLSDFKAGFGRTQRLVDAIARRESDAIVANSRFVVEDVSRRESIDPSRLRVIRNGVEIPAPMSADQRVAWRARWGFQDEHVVVGCVANYKAYKGLELLIDTAAALRSTQPQARYVLVGEGPLRPELERRIEQLDLGSIVVLHGAELDARAMYGAFDIVTLASEAEGLPNALLEGAAAARPLVATAAGGTPEVVIDGVTGRLVPTFDAEAYREALRAMLDDADLRARLGAGALDHVATTFGMDRFVAETAALYEELAAAKGLRGGKGSSR
jgi:glycosyltransferase involved in cell wall biosynthesis